MVLSNRGAAFWGLVRDQMNRPVRQSKVLLVPWPVNSASSYPPEVYETATDANGTFSFVGLRPASCKAIAVRVAGRGRLEEPGRLISLLSDAKSISLHQGEVLSVDLTVLEQ